MKFLNDLFGHMHVGMAPTTRNDFTTQGDEGFIGCGRKCGRIQWEPETFMVIAT